MSGSRRDFLAQSTLGLLGVAVAARAPDAAVHRNRHPALRRRSVRLRRWGRRCSAATFAEAEKLVQVEMTPAGSRRGGGELADADGSAVHERRTGPKKLAIGEDVAPATLWNPMLPGLKSYPAANVFVRSAGQGGSTA